MQFKLAALAAVLSAVSHAQAERTAADVVKELNEITDIAQDTHLLAASINSHTVAEKAPEMVHHYYDMIELINKDLFSTHAGGPSSSSSSSEPLDLGGQAKICEAYRNFAVVSVHLLEKTIEKRAELRSAGYARQLAGIADALHGGVGALSRDVVALVPACRDGVGGDARALDLSLRRAVAFFCYR
ncbi:hypothetical protein F4809DRAFT_661054 [Biscogniauxia mediterranea]|nr:hypothetical protein F4809DRAFT_661054 [Biscogniauxia mediterranea]